MDIDMLKTLDLEELIIIESRLKNSIFDLNKLILELYNENCRILHRNLELNNLKNRSPNAKEGIGNLLKSAFFPKFNKLEEFKSLPFEYNFIKSDGRISKCDNGHKVLFNNYEEKKNYKKSNVNNHFTKSKVVANDQDLPLVKKIPASTCHANLDSNQYDLKPEPISKNEGKAISIEYGNMAKHIINLLIDGNNCVKIKFSKFENDQIRENFAKEIIKDIGLKPIYFDCVKRLLKDIESGSEHVENLIDIANLDPWEN
ncbi:uncharacterized protein ELE39_002856 [Cryptosporidium sp. chipmunk genotype I]|uniref:uncharacterized protein n=1 Tax=Cryptosporidium sp. chipmunk genotype I TaxID=1280935 RepID=UPI003519E829|nr:hypothetical protein ELE39_002856 [Cryptosporidium sp. chipmunk genotype I]